MKKLVLVLALVACGPSAGEIKTAKTTTYQMAGTDLLQVAEQAAEEEYKLGEVNEQQLAFITLPRWYSPEGDLQSPGAGGFVQMDNRSVQVALIVHVTEAAGGDCAVTVTPKTFQYISGSPKPRERVRRSEPARLGARPRRQTRARDLRAREAARVQALVDDPRGLDEHDVARRELGSGAVPATIACTGTTNCVPARVIRASRMPSSDGPPANRSAARSVSPGDHGTAHGRSTAPVISTGPPDAERTAG